jgi:hypothetical protein
MATPTQIDQLRLAPKAKVAAILLNEKFPETVFTSGYRNLADQIRVMAANEYKSPGWIGETYKVGGELQRLIAKTRPLTKVAMQETIEAFFQSKSTEYPLQFSRHLEGYAFDIQPLIDVTGMPTADGFQVVDYCRRCLGAEKVLLREGGLVIWHVQFTPTEDV